MFISFLDPSLVSAGWVLKEATGINDHGAIVGTAVNNLLGINAGHTFLLSPVLEPGTYGMLLAGLGLLAVAASRSITAGYRCG